VTTVLLAEDDAEIAGPLGRAIEREGHQVIVVDNGAAALQVAAREPLSLVVLDIGLPQRDGLDVCRTLRAEGRDVPVLMLTARTGEMDVVIGLDAGADDYVGKPFRVGEVLARVRALLRRSVQGRIQVGPIQLETASRRLLVGGTEVALAYKEFELLRVLMSHAGQVVSRETIWDEVWPGIADRNSKTLDMHMSWLRRKLSAAAEGGDSLITTLRGVGFRYNGTT
jgi:DNA-binding response OmpR family regulator